MESNMIQEIAPKKFHNEYRNEQIKEGAYVCAFYKKGILTRAGQEDLDFPRYEEMNGRYGKEKYTYLFSIDEQMYFLLDETEEISLEGFEYMDMYQTRSNPCMYQVMAASTAWHLNVWYSSNRFCGRCGKPTVHDDKERMRRCPHCGNLIYPKLLPAVIVAVTDGDRILLTKYANRQYTRYALIAGFVEIGETIEETVQREVMEEVGLHVKNIRYYKTQPWGFDQDILTGYVCEVDHERHIHMDREELAVAEWVKREDVPDYGERLSLTHEMMRMFKNGKL